MNASPPAGNAPAAPLTSTSGAPGAPPKRWWRHWDATRIGTLAGVLSVVVGIGAWQWPRPSADPAATATTGATSAPSAIDPTASGSTPVNAAPATAEYLDGTGFPAESGGAYLVSVPRAIRAADSSANHSIAVTCPTNQTGDQSRDITYVLHGRYLRFDAEVQPYYPPGSDTKSATYVTAMIGTTQKDGTLAITEAGRQQRATVIASAALTAPVENAEKLILRVQCGDPNGTIVLANARLTPA